MGVTRRGTICSYRTSTHFALPVERWVAGENRSGEESGQRENRVLPSESYTKREKKERTEFYVMSGISQLQTGDGLAVAGKPFIGADRPSGTKDHPGLDCSIFFVVTSTVALGEHLVEIETPGGNAFTH
jgi:hypothetical protein